MEYLDRNVKLSRNPDDIKKATHLILPGVGSYKSGMDNLFKYDLVEILNSQVITKKTLFGDLFGNAIIVYIKHRRWTPERFKLD